MVVREVKDAEPNRKPIFIQRRGLSKGAFRRVADRLCSNEDLGELLALRKGEIHEVSEVHDSECSDLEPKPTKRYREMSGTEADFEERDLLRSITALAPPRVG